jgi:glycosyltransferase involved in cell wall biosynthesis
MIDIAFHNLLATDYPHTKIEWIVVEDNERKSKMASEKIVSFQIQVPHITLKYIPIEGRMTIGEKRNLGVENASNDIILFMDDDDHYPVSSLSIRMAWLHASGKDCVYASTLPMYDITRYISAMNVPPLNLSPCERVSEATLCFTRDFWEARGFPDEISVAEGEGFLKGRETATVEIPPKSVIVSFLHGKNFTSRRVPEQKEPNGCHYGFNDQYFTLISQLAGLSV